MANITPQTPLCNLTVEEFLEVSKNFTSDDKYEYGLKGLAKILGCSISKASKIKSSGILDDAIIQKGNIIIIDKKKRWNFLRAVRNVLPRTHRQILGHQSEGKTWLFGNFDVSAPFEIRKRQR